MSGKVGSYDKIDYKKNETQLYISKNVLNPQEGITIYASFPLNSFSSISNVKKIKWFISDFFDVIWGVLGLLTLFLYSLISLIKYGIDPKIKRPIVVQYTPSKNINSAELGILLNERLKYDHLVSLIFYMSHKGFYSINLINSEKNKNNVKFILLKDSKEKLTRAELFLLQLLFDNKKEALLSDVNSKLNSNFLKIENFLYEDLIQKNLLANNPVKTVSSMFGKNFLIFIALSGIGVGIQWICSFPHNSAASIIIIFLGFLISCVPSIFMGRKTQLGAEEVYTSKGLKLFIKKVEKPRLEKLAEDPEIFEDILSYAIILNCANLWIKKLGEIASINKENILSYSLIYKEVNRSLKTSAQKSSASRGTSYGRSSSGSSGGGRGGGGGRSW